jgi:hypothetical protein
MTRKTTSFKLNINLVNKVKAIASIKEIQQSELVEEYLKGGVEKDKELLKKLIE